jgi:hypothetical protein
MFQNSFGSKIAVEWKHKHSIDASVPNLILHSLRFYEGIIAWFDLYLKLMSDRLFSCRLLFLSERPETMRIKSYKDVEIDLVELLYLYPRQNMQGVIGKLNAARLWNALQRNITCCIYKINQY